MNIGIDLGTSYSSAAAQIDGKIETIRVSTGASAFGDSFSMPTAIYVDNGQVLLGQAALSKKRISPSCFKSEFKRDFGTTTPYVISGEEYLPEYFYTDIFLYFKEQAVKQTGEKIEKVYITHPANYGNNKKRLLEKAANNAGLFDVILVDEPTAAAAGYSRKNKIVDGDILLVYDLGGGTFDTALIKKTSKGYIHLTEPLGISKCGGIDFDRVIFDDIFKKLGQNGGFDIERLMQEKRFTASLSEVCVQVKHQLTQSQSHMEPIAVGAYDYFEYTITRQEFEDMICSFVANTCEKVKDILKNSGLSESDIDRVLLVGGSSRVPLVQKMVSSTLDKEVFFDADPELAVCQGALCLGETKKSTDKTDQGQLLIIKSDAEDSNTVAEAFKQAEAKLKKDNDESIALKEEDLSENKKQNNETNDSNKEKNKNYNKEKQNLKDIRRSDEEKQKNFDIQDIIIDDNRTSSLKKIILNTGDTEAAGNNGQEVKKPKQQDSVEKTAVEKNIEAEKPDKIQGLMQGVLFGKFAFDGEWIYYLEIGDKKLYKVKTDGTMKTKLSDRSAKGSVFKEGEWIYYLAESVNHKCNIYRVKKDGTADAQISPEVIYCNSDDVNYVLRDNWIYFINEKKHLKKMMADGTKGKDLDLNVEVRSLTADSNWIYYCDFYKLYKISIVGTSQEVLWHNSKDIIDNISVYDGWVFYNTFNVRKVLLVDVFTYKLWKIRENGAQGSMIFGNTKSSDIKAADGWVYYYYPGCPFSRVRYNGTDRQPVSPAVLKNEVLKLKK